MPPAKRKSSSSQVVATSPLLVANWKMQLSIDQSLAAVKQLGAKLRPAQLAARVIVCPSFTSLPAVADVIARGPLELGAQDVAWDERGAYTGEVSPLDLRELGVGYVIIGHSERRQLLGETDAMVGRKMISATTHGLMPILCVGETADERRVNRQEMVVSRQLQAAFRSLPPPRAQRRLSIAYEPVWAIGTGQAAEPAAALTMRDFIHQVLVDLYGEGLADNNFRLLYGGSVTADNITDYVQPDAFHGALIGGASLKPLEFFSLIQRVNRAFV